MAAEYLGRTAFTIAQLVDELNWPKDQVAVGLVESAGGVGSPQADDGDAVALRGALAPDVVLLVADAGLGTINAVRLSVGALGRNITVVLNRFDDSSALHVRNRQWLEQRDGLRVVVLPGEEQKMITLVGGE
jgi:dethiobiotin synthetase